MAITGIDDAARDVDEVGCLAVARGEAGEVAALGSEPGDEKGDVGDAGEDVGSSIGEAEDESDGGVAVLRGGSFGEAGDTLVEWLVVDRETLEVGAAAVRGEGEEVEAFTAGVVEEGLDGVVTHEGIEGDGVGAEVFEAGDGIATLGLTDVGAFDIENDGNFAGDAGDGAFEKGEAFAAEAFEVGAVGLEGGGVRGGVFDEANEVVFDFRDAVVVVFDAGVEADAEVANGGSAGGEFFEKGHGWFLAR